MGGIFPGQSAARTGCDHQLPTSTFHGGSAVHEQSGGSASSHPDARHFSSSLYATGTFQAATMVLELKGSEYG